MSKLILFYCFFEDNAFKFRGKAQSIRLTVKASSPREAKEVSEEMMKQYYEGEYTWKECCQVEKGPRVIDISRMLGREYQDGMVGPI